MANSPQARKRARQADKHRIHNAANRSMMRTYIKKVWSAIESGDQAAATADYRAAVSVIDRSANKGLIHKNKANRHKRRLNAHIQAMQEATAS